MFNLIFIISESRLRFCLFFEAGTTKVAIPTVYRGVTCH